MTRMEYAERERGQGETYADVTVHHQAHAEDAIENGVVRATRNERGDGEGDETGGEDALERPVVGAVRL